MIACIFCSFGLCSVDLLLCDMLFYILCCWVGILSSDPSLFLLPLTRQFPVRASSVGHLFSFLFVLWFWLFDRFVLSSPNPFSSYARYVISHMLSINDAFPPARLTIRNLYSHFRAQSCDSRTGVVSSSGGRMANLWLVILHVFFISLPFFLFRHSFLLFF